MRAAIGLGSNLGDRARHIADAVGALSELDTLVRVSPLYETAPVGGPEQGPYLNAVAVVDTELTPQELLQQCLAIERDAGRERRERWGPRTLDLDLLLYGDAEIDEDGLTVPHPRMTERRFVLEPLLDAWPDAVLPDGTPVANFLPGVADQRVRKLETVVPGRMTSLLLVLIVGLGAVIIWWIGDWLL
ncbi:MAG: 2-amino-4-hydroxy-6-hydroxymethyldihydropteridine diphosphokinase [Acidimicrobiia bacterium]|nr:2-amino-4-hydroxy-6-hydroxymethyldihydropteridine diphosphokinase [Acidimicrobiia bacterium]